MAGQLIDTRVLGKPHAYSNNRVEWPEFQFTLKSYVGAISEAILDMMEKSEAIDSPIKMSTLTEEERQASRTLMYILNGVLTGASKRLLMNTEAHNGIEAYRQLCKREDPSSGSVQVAQLTNILRTKFSGRADLFQEEVEKLEAEVRRYEQTYSEIVGDALLQSILKSNTPANLKQQILLQTFTDYAQLRNTLIEYMTNLTFATGSQDGSAPMDVGAITKGWWSKGGKKDGKSKGKHKDQKGKGKDAKGGKSKKDGNQKGKPHRFQGYCNHCWQWGHRKTECPSRPRAMETGAVDQASSLAQGGSTAAASGSAAPATATASTAPKLPAVMAAAIDTDEDGWIF